VPDLIVIAQSLLRVGIDATGRLELNRLWDIAVRGATVLDLRSSGAITEHDDIVEIDTDATGTPYLDAAIADLLARSGITESDWIQRGGLTAAHVGDQLVATGEWTRHFSLTAPRRRLFRAQPGQQQSLTWRLEELVDDPEREATLDERTLAAIAHTLNVIRAGRRGPDMARSLDLADAVPGASGEIVRATVLAINRLDLMARSGVGSSGTI
jgi:hypothetical protein